MKLTSMTDYVLEQSNNDNLTKASKERDMFMSIWSNIFNYANFLKQPLKLGMFIPCDEDGNILEDPELTMFQGDGETCYSASDEEFKQYWEAEERVLFKGCSATKKKDYYLVNHNNNIKGLQTIWLSWNGSKTVEDLLKLKDEINLELTESAINNLTSRKV